jgi:hypothetical protein
MKEQAHRRLEQKHHREDEHKHSGSKSEDTGYLGAGSRSAIMQKLQITVPTSRISNVMLPLLASVEAITNIHEVKYPEGVKRPDAELNVNTGGGRFRYIIL